MSASSDEAFVLAVLKALKESSLEAIVVGSVAAVLQGSPVTTQDMDLLVRDTPTNRKKIADGAGRLSRGHHRIEGRLRPPEGSGPAPASTGNPQSETGAG